MSHPDQYNPLFASIKQLIEDSKQQVAVAVNATMSMLYWRIGFAINEELKQHEMQKKLRQADCRYTVATIAKRVRCIVFREKSATYDAAR